MAQSALGQLRALNRPGGGRLDDFGRVEEEAAEAVSDAITVIRQSCGLLCGPFEDVRNAIHQ